ncbi:pas domain s-box [Halogeometricum borinquense DSM 11551]|uniref:histidine kinase n=3 Tax=Halogeometricum borinquense TaxID=60847 RepID=E4NSL2_HALBP|nr:PAS domain-containing sensor histidine kinase [Halogeometricum borinquense]ADQ68105.1 PAS domain S-box [Halogeometricum borinquense DSM 11551]ELY24851.1 pas domain s-box [Halogeometricum borinquense DSM 11551]
MKDFVASDSGELLLRVLENVNDVITVRDAETGETLAVSGAVEEMYGYTPEEFSELTIEAYSANHVEYTEERAQELIADARERGEASFEWKAKRADGAEFWTEISISKTELEERTVLVNVVRDITDRKEHELELKRFERLVSLISDPVFTIDENDRIDYVNDATVGLTGYSREELVETDFEELSADISLVQGDLDAIHGLQDTEEDSIRLEGTITRPDGTERTIETNLALLPPTEEGTFGGAVGVSRDITQRKRREEKLERFASVLSHDLRNPLNAAMAQITLLREIEGCDSEYVDTLENLTNRMAEIIDDVLTLTREGKYVTDPETFVLGDVAEEAWNTINATDASLSVGGELGTVEGDRQRVRRLLENLFSNAVRHGGDDISVRIERLPDGFAICDDGPGIPPDERNEVFEYGYSTATDGTGFGLNIVEEIADAHDWNIVIAESDSGGARFEISGLSADGQRGRD